MGDFIDQISQGHERKCPDCPYTAVSIDPSVAVGLLNNHINREHR